MAEEDKKSVDTNFLTLLFSLSAAVMQNLGKVPNQLSGKMERDLIQAKAGIDILLMFKEKTRGNLSTQEESLLTNTLTDLQLNYVDELKKDEGSQHKH